MACPRAFLSLGLLFLICHAVVSARDLPKSAEKTGILPQNKMVFSSELGKETITVEQIGPICRRKGCPPARSPPPPISPSKGVKNNNEEVKEAINPDGRSG